MAKARKKHRLTTIERKTTLFIIGISSGNLGDDNQMRGIIVAGRQKHETTPISRDMLLTAPDGTPLLPHNFATCEQFEVAVNSSIDTFVKKVKISPAWVILPINHQDPQSDNSLVDYLSQTIKTAFAKHNIQVKTLVLASNLYDYKNVDMINIVRHRLSVHDENILKQNQLLRPRTIITLGVPSNVNMSALKHLTNARKTRQILDNLAPNQQKIALFALGGITSNNSIRFTLDDAKKLFDAASIMVNHNYVAVFTNSQRTPNDVSDYLFAQCRSLKNIHFYNSKTIARNDAQKKDFRFYSGKFTAEFLKQKNDNDDIYPAVLSVCDIYIGTHDSFSYTSEAAALGIKTIVYTGNEIDTSRQDCRKLYRLCHKAGYVLSLDEMLKHIEHDEDFSTLRMPNITTQIINALKKN